MDLQEHHFSKIIFFQSLSTKQKRVNNIILYVVNHLQIKSALIFFYDMMTCAPVTIHPNPNYLD